MGIRRRNFIKASGCVAATVLLPQFAVRTRGADAPTLLPEGPAPTPVSFPHFPNQLHAFIWRNWTLVPIEKLAKVISATSDEVLAIGRSMGLAVPPRISADQLRRSYITIIRRNWHLLPYEQLLQILDWTPEYMAYMLREDDFLYIKLGSLKPKCSPLRYSPPDLSAQKQSSEIARVIEGNLPKNWPESSLFGFVGELSNSSSPALPAKKRSRDDAPRFCYSYFALYGDPLLEPENDPYPDGYLQKLANIGVNGVWLQAVLHKLAPFPWINENESEREKRLINLGALAKRAARNGIGIYLYLNEPRAMPQSFFKNHPDLKGVSQGDFAALCTSNPDFRKAIADAVAYICKAAPELAGFFTITASENPTNCWSHGAGAQCPRCSKRSPAEVIAEINGVFNNGIKQAGSSARLLAWDWGWRDEWADEIIERLPADVTLMSVSEWSIPIRRGGVDSVVGEYSISTVGPGPRATRHWALARKRGLRTIAKIQAGNTWELSAVPYIPALENVARHVAQLRSAKVDGLMLGWTLGGYPSPNLQAACEIASSTETDLSVNEQVDRTLNRIAMDQFGETMAAFVVGAWKEFSRAFSEFPFDGGVVYNAPMQYGPSNLLWASPTRYRSTMVGFPYDDLDGWRQHYPAQVFIDQFTKIADGFQSGIATLRESTDGKQLDARHEKALRREIDVASAAAIHFRSTANQARFVQLRNGIEPAMKPGAELINDLRAVILSEIALARELLEIQRRDSRIGFEATNHYYYVPQDLAEKIVNCHFLLNTWIPSLS